MKLLSRLLGKSQSARHSATGSHSSPADSEIDRMVVQARADFERGELADAEASLQRALEAHPDLASAQHLLSKVLLETGRADTALEMARKAVARDPIDPEALATLAGLYESRGNLRAAIETLEELVRARPDAAARLELAAALIRADRLDEAVKVHEAGRFSSAPDARAYYDLGDALLRAVKLKVAERAFERAASMAPDSPGIQLALSIVRREQERPVEAEAAARAAVAMAPDMAEGWFALGLALTKQARAPEALAQFKRALALKPDLEAAWDGILFTMNAAEDCSPLEIFQAHAQWGARFGESASGQNTVRAPVNGRRIRVGYLSGDFRRHSVAFFIDPVLRCHDTSRFEIHCYHNDTREDSVTRTLRQRVEHWRSVATLTDDELERKLREDDLDILVELSGHSQGHRLPVLARRVAPVQVSYLGYPNTTGLAQIDYRITDARADPPGEADRLHTERLLRLPETFLCYAPPQSGDVPSSPAWRRKGYITFGSFNNYWKVSRRCIDLWAAALAAVPESRLFIKAHGLQDAGLRVKLQERLEQVGIDCGRVLIGSSIPSQAEHMQTYAEVDIALDTFPYHGTTTTFDALWMGVPVVTLAGERHASRVGVSILSTLGLDRLIASTPAQYVEIASALAADRTALGGLHSSLRTQLAISRLTDGPRFTSELEAAFLEISRQR